MLSAGDRLTDNLEKASRNFEKKQHTNAQLYCVMQMMLFAGDRQPGKKFPEILKKKICSCVTILNQDIPKYLDFQAGNQNIMPVRYDLPK